MNRRQYKSNKGFVALISAIMISAILLAILFTTNTSTFFARFDALDTEYKRVATGLAESCANQALLKLAQDYYYNPDNETIAVGNETCNIKSVTPRARNADNSTFVTISTQANRQGAFSNFQVEALIYNPAITPSSFPPPPNIKIESWQEVPISP